MGVPDRSPGGCREGEEGRRPEPRAPNEPGSQGWEAVGISLKKGDLAAWPVVMLKRPVAA